MTDNAETKMEFETGSSDVSGQEEESQKTAETSDNTSEQEDANQSESKDVKASGEEADSQGESEKEGDDEHEKVDIQLPEDTAIKDKDKFLELLGESTKSQEGFDNLVDYIKDLQGDLESQIQKSEEEAWSNTLTEWEKELKSNEDFGKDYKGNVDNAMKVAEDIGLAEWLKETGFDKNPSVLKSMLKVHNERKDAEVHLGAKSKDSHPTNPDGTYKLQFKV